MPSYRFRLNGAGVAVEVAEGTPLVWVLRDVLALTGTKLGCGIGACGACTVHVGGVAARSCQRPIETVEGADVTTIEGLRGHPLQAAWIAEDVPQCGYCQSGQIMSAAALIRRAPRPDDATLARAMRGNLCRCGTYARIRRAIRRVAPAPPASPLDSDDGPHDDDDRADAGAPPPPDAGPDAP